MGSHCCVARGWRTGDEIAGEVSCECQSTSNFAKTRTATQSSKPGTCRSMHSGVPWNLCGKQVGSGSRNRLSTAVETSCSCVVCQARCLADYRYNTGRDGCSPFRRIFGKSFNGSICKFGEQVHYKLSGHPSSRVEPRWELGAWVGKTELTVEHLLGTLSGIRNSRTIYRLPKSHCYSKDALDRIVGTPANPKPDGAAKDPQIRRQYITQR